jgi:RNA polymerase sigma factor (sigma-70 family)
MRLKTKSQKTMRIQIEPLTHRSRSGETYRRSLEVEAQIAEAALIGQDELIKRVNVRDFTAAGYFQEECLVYLIRRFQRVDDRTMVNLLTQALIQRCAKHIDKLVRSMIDPVYAQDCYQDVIGSVFGQIIDFSSDKADFAQVRFWLWLDRVTFKVFRKYWKKQAEDWDTDSIDDDEDEARRSKLRKTVEGLEDPAPMPDLRAINTEALSILDPNERVLFELRYYEEWEIENQNPSVMTISKFFGVSDRAIRYRLEKIEAKLRKWQGGQQ